MSKPIVTTEISNYGEMLQDEFELVAQRCFNACLATLHKVDFYKIVLARVERGVSIEDEVPQARGLSAQALKQVVLDLMARAAVASKHAWDLTAGYSSCYTSSIRMSLPEREILPQFDVLHLAQVDAGEVQVKIRTFRRNIEVEVVGSDLAMQQLWFAMSEAALLAK